MCYTAPIESEYLPLSCSTGLLQTEDATFGIIPSNVPLKHYCMNSNRTAKCLGALDESGIREYLRQQCDGKQKCALNVFSEIR